MQVARSHSIEVRRAATESAVWVVFGISQIVNLCVDGLILNHLEGLDCYSVYYTAPCVKSTSVCSHILKLFIHRPHPLPPCFYIGLCWKAWKLFRGEGGGMVYYSRGAPSKLGKVGWKINAGEVALVDAEMFKKCLKPTNCNGATHQKRGLHGRPIPTSWG